MSDFCPTLPTPAHFHSQAWGGVWWGGVGWGGEACACGGVVGAGLNVYVIVIYIYAWNTFPFAVSLQFKALLHSPGNKVARLLAWALDGGGDGILHKRGAVVEGLASAERLASCKRDSGAARCIGGGGNSKRRSRFTSDPKKKKKIPPKKQIKRWRQNHPGLFMMSDFNFTDSPLDLLTFQRPEGQ